MGGARRKEGEEGNEVFLCVGKKRAQRRKRGEGKNVKICARV